MESATNDGQEHTLAGRLLGAVREHISGTPQNQQEKMARARSNETIAEIGADTLAMVPGMRWFAAGGIRAGLMLDPHGGSVNLAGLPKNFAEGVALHGVSKASGKLISHRSELIDPIWAKSGGLFSAGFGMGAIKSGFDERSWQDSSGNLSLKAGFGQLAKDGVLAGAIAVPAGFLGLGAAKIGTSLLPETGISTRLASTGTGLLSGYSAGAVFGGVEAKRHGGSFKEILQGANEGGLIGAATGGLTGAMINHAPLSRVDVGRPGPAGEGYRQLESNTSGRLAENPTFGGMPVKLGSYSLQDRWMPGLKPHVVDEIARGRWPYSTIDEYQAKALNMVPEKMRVYQLGSTELLIPHAYANKLESAQIANLSVGDSYAGLAGVEDVAAMLAHTPNSEFVKSVVIRDVKSPFAPWHEHSMPYPADFAGESNQGQLTLYRPEKNNASATLQHEWSHCLKDSLIKESPAYDLSYELEKRGYNVSSYARNNGEENWAEHMAALIDPHGAKFAEMSAQAPLRTAVLGRALEGALAGVARENRSPYHQLFEERGKYIRQNVGPAVEAELTKILQSGDVQKRAKAAQLFDYLHGNKQLEIARALDRLGLVDYYRLSILEKESVSGSDRDKAVAARVLLERLPDRQNKERAWQQAMRYAGNDADLKTDLALAVFQTSPEMRGRALEFLLRHGQARAAGVLGQLSASADPSTVALAQARLAKLRR